MFTSYQDAVVNRIKQLQKHTNELLQQRKQVKHDKVLKDDYTIAISHLLGAINRMADELAKEKPTDGNQ